MNLRNGPTKKVPSDRFVNCPSCQSQDLLRDEDEGEAFCKRCDWDSISSTLDAIGLRAFTLGSFQPSEPEFFDEVANAHITSWFEQDECQLTA